MGWHPQVRNANSVWTLKKCSPEGFFIFCQGFSGCATQRLHFLTDGTRHTLRVFCASAEKGNYSVAFFSIIIVHSAYHEPKRKTLISGLLRMCWRFTAVQSDITCTYRNTLLLAVISVGHPSMSNLTFVNCMLHLKNESP